MGTGYTRSRFRSWSRWLTFLIIPLSASAGEPVSPADKVAWFTTNAASIRTTNPNDHDFSDLKPIRQAIGNARVVLLGGSNEEAIVKARYRLVRFLHEEMGFDVLTCGLPLFDAAEFDRPLDLGKAPPLDLQELNRNVFMYYNERYRAYNWIDILDYIRETHKTEKPLHLSGFGWVVSPYGAAAYPKHLFQFLDTIVPGLATAEDRKAVQALVRLSAPVHPIYTDLGRRMAWVSQKQWDKTLAPGLAAMSKVYDKLGQIPADNPNVSDIVYYRQTIDGLGYYASSIAGHRLRRLPPDSIMALAKVWRPKSKIIVWSTNGAVGRDLPWLRDTMRPVSSQLPVGSILANEMGRDVYAIAFSEIKSDNGVLQVLQAGPQPKLAPVDGDLESLLHAAGKPYSFVDFRGLPEHHWLRDPLSARFLQTSELFVWPDHFDGLVTVDLPAWKEHKQ